MNKIDKISLKCIGCNLEYALDGVHPVYGCENQGRDDANHILEKLLTLSDIAFSGKGLTNPYLKYKEFFFSYYLADYLNIDYDQIVKEIDLGLKRIGELGFIETPIRIIEDSKLLSGKLIVKDETGNVSGSHKARHLMGNILYLEVLVKAGILQRKPKLAVYSCGNAALGAAAVAKASGYELDVFIPPNVNSNVTDALKKYGANIVVCPRRASGVRHQASDLGSPTSSDLNEVPQETGDPCYNRFQEALDAGSVPFSCSGPDNWSNIEGGQTLCLELMTQLKEKNISLDSIVIQVGGGALASSAVKTLEELYAFKYLKKIPKVYTVQTEGGFPLVRAFYLMIKDIAAACNLTCSLDFIRPNNNVESFKKNQKIISYCRTKQKEVLKISKFIKENYALPEVKKVLDSAKKNLSSYMWSWEGEPHSIAHGILDDITYDWFKIIQGMLETGGVSIIVDEERLKAANQEALSLTNIQVDHTGSSGFAGLIELLELGYLEREENVAVLFTGAIR